MTKTKKPQMSAEFWDWFDGIRRDRDRYLRKRAEYEARRPVGRGAAVGIVLPPMGEALRLAPDGLLRDVARLMLERIEVGAGGLTIIPRPECAAWVPA